MKVIFLAEKDYANVGWAYMQALRSVGVDTQGFKTASHRFKYPYEFNIITPDRQAYIQKIVDSSDIIQVMHSSLGKMNIKLDYKKKNIVVHHGGSNYREQPSNLNTYWNKISRAAIIETPDLLHMGANNEYYIPAPVDTDMLMLTPDKFFDGNCPLRLAHYPTSAKMKGTDVIRKIIHDLKKKFDFEISISEISVPWNEHMGRISKCDIYIDQLVPILKGKLCGEYGVSTREAAALGKVVVSTHMGVAEYNKVFGDTKVVVSNTPEKMKENLIWLLSQSPEDIRRIQEETRNWIVSNHSFIATGKRLKSIYEKILN